MPEDGGLINQALIGSKPVNACVHTYTKPQTSSTRSHLTDRRVEGWLRRDGRMGGFKEWADGRMGGFKEWADGQMGGFKEWADGRV